MSNLLLFLCLFLIVYGFVECVRWSLKLGDSRPEDCPLPEYENIDVLWETPSFGKVVPTARLNCKVCGVWTIGGLCSECCTWAEMQTIEAEKRLQNKR